MTVQQMTYFILTEKFSRLSKRILIGRINVPKSNDRGENAFTQYSADLLQYHLKLSLSYDYSTKNNRHESLFHAFSSWTPLIVVSKKCPEVNFDEFQDQNS